MAQRIAFIGMGEAGGAIVDGWRGAHPVCAFDLKSEDPATAGQMAARYVELGIAGATCPAEAVAEADAVFCTVTADQAVVAAKAASPHLRPGTLWFDLNSCAPSSKRQAAAIIEAAGARYVDVAVMAPVYPRQNMVPLLVSGPHATVGASVLAALPMNPRVVEGPVGAASSIKMIRSIMVKGLEALTAECTLAAVAAGVEDEVFGSLLKSHPGTDWPGQAAYNFERAMVHGARRAAEMEEVAKTVADIGLPQDMSLAVVQWQRRIAGAGVPAPEDAAAIGPRALALALLEKLQD